MGLSRCFHRSESLLRRDIHELASRFPPKRPRNRFYLANVTMPVPVVNDLKSQDRLSHNGVAAPRRARPSNSSTGLRWRDADHGDRERACHVAGRYCSSRFSFHRSIWTSLRLLGRSRKGASRSVAEVTCGGYGDTTVIVCHCSVSPIF